MRRLSELVLTGLLGVSIAPACGEPDLPADDAWLLNTLAMDNRLLLERAPTLVAEKFGKMAVDPHQYLRGTNAAFIRQARTGADEFPASAFDEPAVADVLLVGDAHLENFGTFRDVSGALVVEVNDFDAATYGPFHLDVWRLGLSLDVALAMVDVPPEGRSFVVGAMADSYARAVAAAARGQAGATLDDARAGRVLADLLKRAAADGKVAEELEDYSTATEAGRDMRWGTREPPGPDFLEDALAPVTRRESELVAALLARWPATLAEPDALPAGALEPVSPVARRLGAGIGSYPLLRYYVVLEGPTAGRRDDWLVELKEAPAPAALPSPLPGPARRFVDNGARIVAAQRALHGGPSRDALLGHATVGPASFRIRHRTKYQKGLEVMRLQEKWDDWTLADVEVLARELGTLLGQSHARASNGRGAPAASSLAGVLDGRETAFVTEVVQVAAARGERLRAEYARFLRLRETLGPSLGLP
jgi:uncharacterized protein (DUF2252 family)